MSTDILVNQLRGQQTITLGISLQLDAMSQAEAAYYGGAAPYYRYEGYFLSGQIDIEQYDLLIDQNNIDVKTKMGYRYRIVNQPEWFPDFHYELVADRVFGT